MSGKQRSCIGTLKRTCEHGDIIHENNQLRRANERLRADNARLAEDLEDARRSLASSHAMKEHYRIHYEDLRDGGDR